MSWVSLSHLVSRQGKNRIVVELPGVQDTAEAKRIIGKTANLEFRLAAIDKVGEVFHFRTPSGQGPDADLRIRLLSPVKTLPMHVPALMRMVVPR